MAAVSDRATARAAKTALATQLSTVPGIVGVGLARDADGYVIKVDLVDGETAERVPGQVDGVLVITEVTGGACPLGEADLAPPDGGSRGADRQPPAG